MAVYRVYKFSEIFEVETFLNGGIVGGLDVSRGVYGLDGQALTFSAPGFSVNFAHAGGGSAPMMFNEIKEQIEAGNPDVIVQMYGGRIVIREKNPTNGISLGAGAEAAKSLLGFDPAAAVVGRKYSPDTEPKVQSIAISPGSHVIITYE